MENNNIDNALEGYCISLVNTLIKAYYGDKDTDYNNDGEDKEVIDGIVDYAVSKAIEIRTRISPTDLNKIYSGDIIILSIDNGPAERYLLTRSISNCKQGKYKIRDLDGWEHDINRFKFISDYSNLGKELLCRCVGEEFRYSDDEDKNEHTVKILFHQRTTTSLKVTRYEIEADETYRKAKGI